MWIATTFVACGSDASDDSPSKEEYVKQNCGLCGATGKCHVCGGTGKNCSYRENTGKCYNCSGGTGDCPKCDGYGYYTVGNVYFGCRECYHPGSGAYGSYLSDIKVGDGNCSDCHGKGKCPTCGGSGTQ